MKTQSVYFTSDLHLRSPDEPKALALGSWLDQLSAENSIVIFGGDIFDLFIGNKKFFRDRFAPLLQKIAAFCNRGGELIFIEGNHDFHFRGAFAGVANRPAVFAEDFALTVGETKIYVSHGDQINRRDLGYLFLRFLMRTYVVRFLIWLLPGTWIGKIGNFSSKASRQYTEPGRRDPAHAEATRELFRQFANARGHDGYKFVLLGHSHLEDDIALASGGRYFNLGFYPQNVPILVIENSGVIKKLLS